MAAPPKPDAVVTEASARAIVAYHRAERWKRIGAMLLVLLLIAGVLLFVGYQWGIEAQRLAGCW